jgi:predicted  nucleic acid-binding Zn-ribbon protein
MGDIPPPFFMKKKVKKMLDWFYQDTDRGEQNISECKSLYDLVERLQYRLEDMENEHMQLTREIARLQGRIDTLESQLSNED